MERPQRPRRTPARHCESVGPITAVTLPLMQPIIPITAIIQPLIPITAVTQPLMQPIIPITAVTLLLMEPIIPIGSPADP